jgi:hypothetical protein
MGSRLTSALLASCALLLAACSSGGGGGAPGTSSATTVVLVPSPAPPSTPPATVSALADASLHGSSLPLASAATPNFAASLPATGAVFPFSDSVVRLDFSNGTTGASAVGFDTGGTTLTFQGTQNVSGTTRTVFSLKVPALSLDVPNIPNGSVTLSDGSHVTLTTKTLDYTLLGFWALVPEKGTASYWGRGITGYQTPASGVPVAGTAHYTGGGSAPGGVFGDLFIASNTGLLGGTVAGKAVVDVNFATGTVTGALINMTAVVPGETLDMPWNDVALSGNLSGAAVRGATSVASTPSNELAIGSGAKGTFVGSLFGPNAQEIGINWNLYDPGGKTVSGVLGAATP